MTAEQLQLVQSKIKHVIVLMLENRSFDHMLGYATFTGKIAGTNKIEKIDGIDKENPPFNNDISGNPIYFSDKAPFILDDLEPGHEFKDVLVQLTGNLQPAYDQTSGIYPTELNNRGFVINFQSQKKPVPDPSVVMKGFSPNQVPVINQLANEFVVCDRWFSSIPGPTWPNRFFVHAASSGGLDQSPTLPSILEADTFFGYHFDKGTIFKCLSEHRLNWAIYAGNKFPQSLALKGVRSNDIFDFKDLKNDIQQPGFPAYTFIEPDYGHFLLGNYKNGNSQHPLDDVTSGEKLIKEVYETIRNSPIWEQTIFVLTYDEHGGFYDHVIPPSDAVDPADSKHYSKNNFNFRQYGLRVPAIIVSPLIEHNLIDRRIYDHSSILASLEKLFEIGNLTQRDFSANNFLDLVTLENPRETPRTLVAAADSHQPKDIKTSAQELDSAKIVNPNEEVDSSLAGFVHIANLMHMETASPAERKLVPQKLNEIDNRVAALTYMSKIKKGINPVPIHSSVLNSIKIFFTRIFVKIRLNKH